MQHVGFVCFFFFSCGMRIPFLVVACKVFSCSMWDPVPWTGNTPRPLHWEHRVPATEPPGKSLSLTYLRIIMFSRFIHIVPYISTLCILTGRCYSIIWISHSLFLHLLADEHLSCFHFLIIMNNIASTFTHKFLPGSVSFLLGIYLGMEFLDHMVTSV